MLEPNLYTDKFTGKKCLDWITVCGIKPREFMPASNFVDSIVTRASNDNYSVLSFAPVCLNEQIFLKLRFQDKYFKPKKGNTLSFLFENNEIHIFTLPTNPADISKHENLGLIKEIFIPITYEQLLTFAIKQFDAWKFKSINFEILFHTGASINENYRHEWVSIDVLQKQIKNLFSEFISILNREIPSALETENNATSQDLACSVYLMRDTTNGAYKIGISNKPEYRERTLLSEKPTIELLGSKKFHKRKIAEVFEKSLHELFKSKRIRGEWFELNNDDIVDIKQILNM